VTVDLLDSLCNGTRAQVVLRGGRPCPRLPAGCIVFPGSFAPLHDGHRRMAYAATVLTGRAVCFEISLVNVDKGRLDPAELQRRLAQFGPQQYVAVTRAARFSDKAALFVGHPFLVGSDTVERLFALRYYRSAAERDALLAGCADAGTRFLVAGRRIGDRFMTLDDLAVPRPYLPMFTAILPDVFALDISSTALRAAAPAAVDGGTML
jgi:hypothetical protein